MSNIALIDLGTNTFHLLIVDRGPKNQFRELYRAREFVKLAEDGIDKIGQAPWIRGIETLKVFREAINRFNVEEIRAVGTAAIRTAENGLSFIEEVRARTGIQVTLIDGEKEAELIYRGVSQVWKSADLPCVIMDIGGGSVEFIIADHIGIKWARSYPIGVAVLFRNFHHSDPISLQEQAALRSFLTPFVDELSKALRQFNPICLIGASGTFDVLVNFFNNDDSSYTKVDIKKVKHHLSAIVHMDHLTRKNDDRIPLTRVDMIVVAALLIQIVLNVHPFQQMSVSQYALKEGLLDF